MLVTISGLPGSGTSTVARSVAAKLDLDHVDGGQVFRSMAAERGIGMAEFGRIAEADPAIDIEIDTRLADRGRRRDVVLESRLAGWIAVNEGLDALTVWVSCEDGERARRVAGREASDPARARRENEVREASEAARYLDYYGIDIADLSIYDLVIDSTAASPEEIVAQVVAAARRVDVAGARNAARGGASR